MRKWIWEALCAVILHGAYSNLYLKDHLNELPEKDRGLAARIFYGTLQNYRLCTAMWQPYVKRKISGRLGVLLSMSCYQLAFLDKVPAYAVIDEAVALSKKINARQGSFINAVLRNVQKEQLFAQTESVQIKVLADIEDSTRKTALAASLPEWLIRMWQVQYGENEAALLAESSTETLPVYVRVNPLQMSQEELEALIEEKKLINSEHGMGLYIYPSAGLGSDPLYLEGKISAMDPGSYAIACFGKPQPGERVLDVCAAPGTKTMAMAELMKNEGHIDAHDLHQHRVDLIEQDADRLHMDIVSPSRQDSTRLPAEEYNAYDLVLCDVPCSGYGVLARKPDMKLRLNPEDMDSLIPLQQNILVQASECVKPEGRLVYSTCTLNKKENEKQVEKFLSTHPGFILEEQQTLMATPEHDGFYMARLRRKA